MSKSIKFVSLMLIAAFMLASCAAPTAVPVPPTKAPAAPAAPAAPEATKPPAPTAAPAQPTAVPPTPTKAPPTATPVPPTPTIVPAVVDAPKAANTYKGGAVTLVYWTKEGDADGALPVVKGLANAFAAANPNVKFEIVNKNVEKLREDFQTASLANKPPDLLWTVSDHAGPFTTAKLIDPVDALFVPANFVDSALAAVRLNNKTWGIPVSNGNHLMLLYNKDMVKTAPKDTAEMIKVAKENTKDGKYGLVFNQTEPFWLVPWLGGFGGQVFDKDGVTPTLNNKAMTDTLQFLADLKNKENILPKESDYDGADSMFKEGKAAMIINGDWSLSAYKEKLKDKLGVAPIPKVTATGKYPAPYTSGIFLMIPAGLKGDKLEAVKAFSAYLTGKDVQLYMLTKLTRLPVLKDALDEPVIVNDPILKGSAEQMTYGTPMPTVLEMRCNWDAMKPEMISVLGGKKTPADAAKSMQDAALACIKKQK
jgi:arabinogalactan oligomer / maltooligosaccharide transport system substrate-binding protein